MECLPLSSGLNIEAMDQKCLGYHFSALVSSYFVCFHSMYPHGSSQNVCSHVFFACHCTLAIKQRQESLFDNGYKGAGEVKEQLRLYS